MSHVLPPAEYYRSLPKHIAGAGCLIREAGHDDQVRVLLVKPSYRPDQMWELPGGGLDPGESPWQTASREITEELGLKITPGRLLAVDWVPAQPDGRPALANYIFDGGTLSKNAAAQQIRLQPDELTCWEFASESQWATMLPEHMVRRLHACVAALSSGTATYLQHGWAPENR